jgi:beta-N-acetylhexosaminidase
MGGPADRAMQALEAGCDMLLMCNKRDAQVAALDRLPIQQVEASALLKRNSFTLAELRRSQEWKDASTAMTRMLDKL